MSKSIHSFKDFKQVIKQPKIQPFLSFEPYFFKVYPLEEEKFNAFCQAHHLQIIENIQRQLDDVIRVNNPSLNKTEDRLEQVLALLADKEELAKTTNWVYFPWSQKVIHILNEAAYFRVITNRNQYKITAAEQAHLQQQTIGVIGLSVGGETAVTVCQEHLCGTIKIADFDELDLSNLNRLNASIEEIGLLKTTITARKIYRINPYLKVIPFSEGVHEKNMSEFLEGLDLLIEECDSTEIKIPIRKAAKALKINTIYAADEKGMLSIEPYGNLPD